MFFYGNGSTHYYFRKSDFIKFSTFSCLIICVPGTMLTVRFAFMFFWNTDILKNCKFARNSAVLLTENEKFQFKVVSVIL